MTLSDITNKITFYTDAGTDDFSNANRIISINNAIDYVVSLILESQDGWDYDDKNHSDFPILTADLVTDQQDYELPTDAEGDDDDVIAIKRVEITYDGTNWYKAAPLDVDSIGTATDTTSIASDFDKEEPYYDVAYGSLFLYPIPDSAVTGGLKIWIVRNTDSFDTTDLSTGTATPGFDRMWHEMIPLKAALDYAIAKGKANVNQLQQQLLLMEDKLKSYYGSKQKDRRYSLGAAYIDYN